MYWAPKWCVPRRMFRRYDFCMNSSFSCAGCLPVSGGLRPQAMLAMVYPVPTSAMWDSNTVCHDGPGFWLLPCCGSVSEQRKRNCGLAWNSWAERKHLNPTAASQPCIVPLTLQRGFSGVGGLSSQAWAGQTPGGRTRLNSFSLRKAWSPAYWCCFQSAQDSGARCRVVEESKLHCARRFQQASPARCH